MSHVSSHSTDTRRPARPLPSRRRRDRRGAAVVEFAIVANTMFLSIFTCVEFARLNLIRNTAQNAAYYGARAAMVSGATAADATAAANGMLTAIGAKGVTITVNDGSALTASTPQIEVKVEVLYNQNAYFAPLFIPNHKYETTAKMKSERYEFFYDGSI